MTEIPSKAEDTLMSNVSLQESETLYKSEIYLNASAKDVISPLVHKQCTKCDENIIRQIMVSDRGEAIYVCPVCENKFM